ncbi:MULTISPECIES: hypothetical protein [unclassified Sporolactobacillus]|uniref:hypothetical protein n=1 Tax=unclassified Sporolactobacillus TaxID=2628533 RepID=UPI0023687D82|nr:hypothetical protein [Sporolactobacillus sp. CQH2019]MDD9150439.1 hypothetical protein [Sporolactobacillus sp. CQH2019]
MRTWVLNIATLIIFAILIAALGTSAAYWAQRSQAYDFRQYVDYQIQRNGGLTGSAMTEINAYDQQKYGGRYRLESKSGNGAQPYGSVINYQVKVPERLTLLNIQLPPQTISGSAVSLVRGDGS